MTLNSKCTIIVDDGKNDYIGVSASYEHAITAKLGGT